MSKYPAFIGTVKAPHNNSPHDGAEVWCHSGRVEISLLNESSLEAGRATRTLDPIASRTLAALLVRASEECERMMRDRAEDRFAYLERMRDRDQTDESTGACPKCQNIHLPGRACPEVDPK